MNRGIYATATGMIAGQKWLDVVANNLANVSTNGFKRDELAFSDAYVREMRLNGGRGASIGSLGSGAALVAEYTIFEPGAIAATGNPLDVAIPSEKGLFAVETPQGIRYTRDGAFQLDQDRRLVTKQGHPVLDDGKNPIELPKGELAIQTDGRIMAGGQEVARLGVFDGTFTKSGGGLFIGTAEAMEEPEVNPGALEGSNVNAIEAMIQMISVSRSFEMAQKSITQQDELTQRLIQSLQDR
ncbi:MAG: flagellar hook-basal body protein [Fimbriimonadaceae bacterium]